MIETKVQSAVAHSKGKSLRIIDKSNIGVKGSVILGSGSGTGTGTGAGAGAGTGANYSPVLYVQRPSSCTATVAPDNLG